MQSNSWRIFPVSAQLLCIQALMQPIGKELWKNCMLSMTGRYKQIPSVYSLHEMITIKFILLNRF